MTPDEILKISDPMDLVFSAGEWIEQQLEGKDPELLSPNWHLITLCRFMGTWENSGTVLHQAEVWGEEVCNMDKLFEFWGGGDGAKDAFRNAIELNEKWTAMWVDDIQASDEFQQMVDGVGEKLSSHLSYSNLANQIRKKSLCFG